MTSRFEQPSETRRSKYPVVRASCATRTMTMRHNAAFAWRSPPWSSRTRPLVLPEDAGIGATPQRWAKADSDLSRSGLSPAVTKSAAAVSGPTPKRAKRSGAKPATRGVSRVRLRSRFLQRRRWLPVREPTRRLAATRLRLTGSKSMPSINSLSTLTMSGASRKTCARLATARGPRASVPRLRENLKSSPDEREGQDTGPFARPAERPCLRVRD